MIFDEATLRKHELDDFLDVKESKIWPPSRHDIIAFILMVAFMALIGIVIYSV